MHNVGILQMNSVASVTENLQTVKEFCREAYEKGLKLLLLPENFAFMGCSETDKIDIAEEDGRGFIQDSLKQLSKNFQLWIIAGTLPIRSQDINKVYARSMVYNNEGERVNFYDKIHLFDVSVENQNYAESNTLMAGSKVVVSHTPIGKVGLSVCYDLRFPELYRQLTLKGAQILVVPSAFTKQTGRAHWECLLRARAIENLAYVLAANQTGRHANQRQTYGHSMIINPWGEILCEEDNDVALLTAEVNIDYLIKVRREFPTNNHHVL